MSSFARFIQHFNTSDTALVLDHSLLSCFVIAHLFAFQQHLHCFLSSKTVHCVEWARDRFEKLFSKQPQVLARVLADASALDSDIRSLKIAMRLLSKTPSSFSDCVAFARRKFQKVCCSY